MTGATLAIESFEWSLGFGENERRISAVNMDSIPASPASQPDISHVPVPPLLDIPHHGGKGSSFGTPTCWAEGLPPDRGMELELETGGAPMPRLRPAKRLSDGELAELRTQLMDLLDRGWI